jgi:hypothetical protein
MKGSSIMKSILFCAAALLAASLNAADSKLKEEVTNAAKKLGEKENYAWRTTVEVPESARFRPGPTEGKTEKGGITHVTMSFGGNTAQAVLKGDKAAVLTQDGDWQSVTDLENSEGPGQFMARFARNIKTPAVQAAELVADIKELKKEGDAYSGELSEEGAKALLRFGRRGGDGPTVNNPKGSAKFWVKDGVLSKYEYAVKGTIDFNNSEIEVDRTTKVEIQDVGTTKLDVPEEAKKKLS